MNDNLDDWLDSLGLEPTDTPATILESPSPVTIDTDAPSQPAASQQLEEPQTQSLSEQDFDDILGDFGFTPPDDIDAEEVIEEEDEEVEETNDDGWSPGQFDPRDLDAEEDADWQEAIDSGGIVPVESDEQVHFHMPDGEVVDVPIIHEEATEEQQEISSNREEPLLPLNSPTLLLDESTTRFSGAEWYNEIQRQNIIFAGIGGIGSNCCFQLARMHPAAIFMYDDDMVETVNMAGQLYARNDVGKSKVSAMADMITSYTNMQNVFAIKDRFTSNTEAGNVMMCGFDNMEARKTFFLKWQEHVGALPEEERKKCLFLDGRLSIDTLQVFCLTGDDTYNLGRYSNNYLFDDSEAEHTVCSMKQTTYLACMIGSIMVNLFTNWTANLLDPLIPYDLPFFTEYDAQNMIFKTIK